MGTLNNALSFFALRTFDILKEELIMNAYKMHEVRMWTVQVIIPAILVGGYVMFCTDIPDKIRSKAKQIKERRKEKRNANRMV